MRLVTALRNGAIDIVIVTGEAPLFDNNTLPLWSERILVALPEGHRLADEDTIYWTDLRDETVLLSQYDPGREFEDLLMSKLVSQKIVLKSNAMTSVAASSRASSVPASVSVWSQNPTSAQLLRPDLSRGT